MVFFLPGQDINESIFVISYCVPCEFGGLQDVVELPGYVWRIICPIVLSADRKDSVDSIPTILVAQSEV